MVEEWGEGNFYDFGRNVVDRSRSKSAIWNGDSHSNYTGLQYSIVSGIRSGLIGFSQWGSDTGGYIRDLDDPHQDLWSRWMWFSAFSPVYEIMIGTNHTPWYPTTTNPYTPELTAVLKETTDLHYDLFPYIKSYTYLAHKTGIPVIRAAFLEMTSDSRAYSLTGEYFFGSEMFIAPIANPDGRRSVYFPKGTKYLEYFNKTSVYAGGTTAEVEMDVHYVPAYVRAGAIVPRGQIYQGNDKWTDEWKPTLTIELYPSADVPSSTFSYYNGDENAEVNILMTVDSNSGDVVVKYGALGVSGYLAMYTKTGVEHAPLHATGGSGKFSNVQSLFDS